MLKPIIRHDTGSQMCRCIRKESAARRRDEALSPGLACRREAAFRFARNDDHLYWPVSNEARAGPQGAARTCRGHGIGHEFPKVGKPAPTQGTMQAVRAHLIENNNRTF